MTQQTAILISDPYRTPVTAQRRMEGGVILRSGSRFIAVSETELARLIEFVQPRIQRFPVG